MMNNTKKMQREKRKERVKKKIRLTSTRPVLTLYRSNTNIYVQILDQKGEVLVSSSTLLLSKNSCKLSANKDSAIILGKEIARLALEKNIASVTFNRGAHLYHGVVKALAESAREAGLQF